MFNAYNIIILKILIKMEHPKPSDVRKKFWLYLFSATSVYKYKNRREIPYMDISNCEALITDWTTISNK